MKTDYFRLIETGEIFECSGTDDAFFWAVEADVIKSQNKFDQSDCIPYKAISFNDEKPPYWQYVPVIDVNGGISEWRRTANGYNLHPHFQIDKEYDFKYWLRHIDNKHEVMKKVI